MSSPFLVERGAGTLITAVADPLIPAEKRKMERETGFEPATNSLEGCDSTPELLPLGSVPADAKRGMVEADGFEPP